jgi:hypothetical protein
MTDINEFVTALEDWFLDAEEITDTIPSTDEQ